MTLLCSSASFPSSPVRHYAGQPMVGQNKPKILSKRRLFHMLLSESFQLGFRRRVLGLDSLITDYRPKICAVTNAIKGTCTGAVVVKTQLYGIEMEHRNKQDNRCCKAYIISEALRVGSGTTQTTLLISGGLSWPKCIYILRLL